VSLPVFLQRPVSTEESQQALAQRLARRPAGFLDLIRHAVYHNPSSANRQLLRHAGCELGDLENLVRSDGVEGALATLLRQGVYMTVDELKGRRPIVRGNTTIHVGPESLGNPLGALSFTARAAAAVVAEPMFPSVSTASVASR
jgi:hypothetical protein